MEKLSKDIIEYYFNNPHANGSKHMQKKFNISGSMMDNLTTSGRVQVSQNGYELPQKMTQVFSAMQSGADFDYLGYNFSLDNKNGWYDKTENKKKNDPFTYYNFEELKELVDPQGYLELYDEFKDINPIYNIGSNKTKTAGSVENNEANEAEEGEGSFLRNFFRSFGRFKSRGD